MFEGKGQTYISSFKRSNTLKIMIIVFFRVSNGVSNDCSYLPRTVIKSFVIKRKWMKYVWPEPVGLLPEWHEVKSKKVRHWSVIVCGMAFYGFFFSEFTIMVSKLLWSYSEYIYIKKSFVLVSNIQWAVVYLLKRKMISLVLTDNRMILVWNS